MEVSGAVRLIYNSLGVKGLKDLPIVLIKLTWDSVGIVAWLWAGKSGIVIRVPVGAVEFSVLESVHTSSGAHQAIYSVRTGDSSCGVIAVEG